MTAAGSVSDFTADIRADIKLNFATLCEVPTSDVSLSITAASVIITVEITAAGADEATSLTSTVTAELSSASAASTFLGNGITVTSTPSVSTVVERSITPSPPPLPPSQSPPALGLSSEAIVMVVLAAGVVALAVLTQHILRKSSRQPKGEMSALAMEMQPDADLQLPARVSTPLSSSGHGPTNAALLEARYEKVNLTEQPEHAPAGDGPSPSFKRAADLSQRIIPPTAAVPSSSVIEPSAVLSEGAVDQFCPQPWDA